MLGMGWVEIFMVVVIALLAVGPEKLPEVARSLGRFIRQVQRFVGEFRDTIDLEEFDTQIRQSGTSHLEAKGGQHIDRESIEPFGKDSASEQKERVVGKQSVNTQTLAKTSQTDQEFTDELLAASPELGGRGGDASGRQEKPS